MFGHIKPISQFESAIRKEMNQLPTGSAQQDSRKQYLNRVMRLLKETRERGINTLTLDVFNEMRTRAYDQTTGLRPKAKHWRNPWLN